MLRFILVLITAYVLYLLHKSITAKHFNWKLVLSTIVLLFIGIGVGGNSQQTHYSATDVQAMQQKYKGAKHHNDKLRHQRTDLIAEKSDKDGQLKKVKADYHQKQGQFQQEADQKKQQAEQKKEQKRQQREQKEQQEKAEQAQRDQQEQQEEAQRQQQAQQAEQQKKQQQQVAAQQQQNTNSQSANNQNGRMVWIAPESGRKYHYDPNCRGLNRANSKQQITEQQAIAEGYTLCKWEGGQ